MTDNNTSPSDDDIIPFETGIPLIDADPEVIARRLADSTWERRANFFSNIITGSITNAIEIGELYKDKDAEGEGARVELNLTLCAIHERVGEILEIWGVEDPPDVHAACIFALSMAWEHRSKAGPAYPRIGLREIEVPLANHPTRLSGRYSQPTPYFSKNHPGNDGARRWNRFVF